VTRYPLRITHRRDETPDAVSLDFGIPQDLRHAFAHKPGQFVTIAVEIDGEPLERSYSISSLPAADAPVRITVKRVPGGKVSNWLADRASPGQLIEVAAPRGRFFVAPDAPVHVVLLGAGSGMAPLVPIARHLCRDRRHRVTLACGQRTESDLLLRDELEQLGKEPGCEVLLRLSRPGDGWAGGHGRVDAAFIASQLPLWRESGLPLQFYLCGPQSFMSEALAALGAAGIDGDQVRQENFSLTAEADNDEPGLPVTGADAGEPGVCERVSASVSGEEYEVVPEPGESLLASLLRVGAAVPYSCLEGTCASCIAKVKHGTVDLRPGVLQVLPPKDLAEGMILACLARPTSTRVHIDFDDI
jgi:ferredoxin-NADP reductase